MATIDERPATIRDTDALKQEISNLRESFSRELQYYATKADVAELRGEIRNLRLIIGVIGVGLAALNVILKFVG